MRKIIVAMLYLVLVVSFTACSGQSLTHQQQSSNGGDNRVEKIEFPAYKLQNTDDNPVIDVDTVNNTPTFALSFPLQEGWEIKSEKGDETLPTGVFYTPVYIYESDKLIGYIAFSPFEFGVPDDTPKEEAYPYIFPNRVTSQYQWEPYTAVKATENGEVGVVNICYMDPNDVANHPGAMPDVDQFVTTGIVAYDIELRVSAAVAFMPDTISKEQAVEIAKGIEIISATSS